MRVTRRLVAIAIVVMLAVLALMPSAISATDPVQTTREVVLARATPLRANPDASAPIVRDVPLRAADGVPAHFVATDVKVVGGVPWMFVTNSALGGWVRQASTARTATPSLSPVVIGQLGALAQSIAGDIGIVVMDRAGHVEWSFHPYRARILASNTKLFVTGRAAHRSAGIGGQLRSILLPSNNALAQRMYTAEGGAAPIARFADSLNASVTLTDGSGLSRSNVASPIGVATYLVGMATDQHFSEWFRALPVAGVSGTLADRMVGTAAQGRCHAKTGTLIRVSALSGYCTALSRRHLVFSILMNGVSNVDQARAVQDRIVELLVRRG